MAETVHTAECQQQQGLARPKAGVGYSVQIPDGAGRDPSTTALICCHPGVHCGNWHLNQALTCPGLHHIPRVLSPVHTQEGGMQTCRSGGQ